MKNRIIIQVDFYTYEEYSSVNEFVTDYYSIIEDIEWAFSDSMAVFAGYVMFYADKDGDVMSECRLRYTKIWDQGIEHVEFRV